jgi:hypothetical protein
MLAASGTSASPRLEIEAGPSYTWLLRDPKLDFGKQSGRRSFSAGLLLQFPVSARIGLAAGLRYARFGDRFRDHLVLTIESSFDTTVTSGEFESRTTMSYMLLPLRLTLRPLARHPAYLALGPELGYLVSSRDEIETLNFSVDGSNVPDVGDGIFFDGREGFEHWILLAEAEVGADFRLRTQGVRLGLRYIRSVTHTTEGNGDRTLQSVEAVLGLTW